VLKPLDCGGLVRRTRGLRVERDTNEVGREDIMREVRHAAATYAHGVRIDFARHRVDGNGLVPIAVCMPVRLTCVSVG